MEHENIMQTPQVSANPHQDPGDFVAEQARIQHAKPNYVGVFLVLAVLTGIEITLVQFFPATVGRVPVLLFLTIAKGLLVVLYYMHLKFDSRIYSVFFGAGIFALAVPFVLTLVILLNPPQLKPVREAIGGNNGGGAPVARPTANPNAGPPVTLTEEGSEFAFKPPTESVNAGQAVNIVLNNTGSVEHTWVLASKPKSQDAEPWTSNDGKLIVRAAPGGSARGGFIAPGPGEWVYYCNVPGHAAAGMVGTLTIK